MRLVIGTHNRDWYLEALIEVVLRQLPAEQICISDDASTEADLLAILDWAEQSGVHVIRWPEHTYLDPTWNRGIRWAIEDGAEFVIVAEDGIIPAANCFAELVSVLRGHESFWLAHPILSAGPEHQYGRDPGVDLSGLPAGKPIEGNTHGGCFRPDEAMTISEIMGQRCADRRPRWRTTFDADWPLWAMKRACWEKIGLPDEAFKQGWGTNSDYCRRVIAADHENVICERAFVFHQRDMYFDLATKQEWMGLGAPIIADRYGPNPQMPEWNQRDGDD